jgi:hypothetical protein
LITKKRIDKKSLQKALKSFSFVKQNGVYFYLKGRSSIVSLRKKREYESRFKIQEALKIAKIISFIPFVQFIGLSGSVAMKNCDFHHDIDFFIVTKSHTLWISRFIILSILILMQKKRKPYDIRTQNKICMNMFVTIDSMKMPMSKRNLYTAHEVVQVKPLINKNNTYESFLFENRWVHNYLANISIPPVGFSHAKTTIIVRGLDTLYFFLQAVYMKRKKTTEYVKKDAAFFHPGDYKNQTLDSYKTKYRHYQNSIATIPQKARKKAFSLASKKDYLASKFTPGS